MSNKSNKISGSRIGVGTKKAAVIRCFIGDYKDKPRGRIFYEPKEQLFKVCVGDWIKENRDAIDIIVDEFGLLDSTFDFVISNHWDIGMGWENR